MSKIKELFNERRVPTPGFILNLFTNDECIIDDEDKFFENVQRNIAGITIIERSASEYDAWKYMLFRMFELLERRLKELSDLKANNYADANELKKVERSIEVIIHFFDEYLRKIDELEEFSFPYFDQILDLTSNHQIVKNLTILGLTILFHQTYNQNNLIYLTSLQMFLDPFIRMLHHFEWDYGLMIKSLREIFAEKSSTEKFPDTLKDLLKVILDNGSTIIQIVEEKALLESLETEPRTRFISNLHSEICKHNGIIKLENEQKYYKALGETALAAFLLAPELNEKLLPDIATMHCFKGTYFEPLRTNDDIPAKIMGFSFETHDFQFKFILKPSIVDVAVSKCRDLTDLNNHRPEIQTEKLDEVIAFLVGIKRNIELFKASTILQDPGDDIIVFLKKLCCLDPQVDTSSQDPPLIEIWKIANKLYKQHYSKVEDESYNTFGKLTESVKDKVNVLMYNTVSLIGSSMSEITEGIEEESGESQETFREEFYLTANYLIEELVKKFEEFSLENDYTSIIVMFAMCSTFKEISYIQVSGSLHIPVRMIKKLESMLKLSYTPEFAAYFENTPQPEFAFKVLLYLLEMIGTVFASYDGSGTLATSAKNEYIAYMSNFNIIDIIAGNNNQSTRPANEHARRSQEELIRYYIALHLESQLLVFSNTQTEQTIFYDFEKLKLIWRLIMDYSTYENYIEDEFNMTLDIIDNLEGEDSMMKQAQILDAEVMSALFEKCFLNLDVAVDLKEFEPIKDILVALSERDGWDIFTTQLSITLQQKFEALVDAQEILESLYVQQDPLFTKNFMANEYRISEFFKRIRPLLKLMRTYDFTAFSNDMNLKSVLSEYLPRLMTSPSFYLIGYTGGTELVSMMSRLTIISSILEKVLPDYALRAFETIVTINQGLQDPDPNSLIRRMLDSEKGRHYSMDKFFVANFLDNPFEIHTLGSKLFYAVYLNSLGLKNLLDIPALQPPINDFLMVYNFRLPDIIEALVKMEHLRLKIRLKQGINPSVATFLPVNDEDFNSWSPISSARDYFQNKSTLLMDMFTKSEKQNTGSDDNFLYKCSIFLLMQDMVSVLPPEDLLNLYSIDGSIEKMFEFTFTCLQKIIAIISTNTSKISEFQLTGLKINMQDEGEVIISEQNLKCFYEYLCRIIGDEFDNFGKQANQSFISFYRHDKQKADLIKGQVSNYLRRVGESMAYSLPKIDQNLLKLSVLDNTDNPIISPLSRMMKNMFLLYARILTKVAEIYGTKEEETKVTKKKQTFKPKLDKKGKGAKGHRGAKGARRRSSQLLDHQTQVAQKEEEAKAEDSDEEVEEFEEDDDGDQILEQGRQIFKEMISRFFIFYNLEFDTPTIVPAYRKVFNSFLENCLSCLETMKSDPNFSSGSVNFLNSRVYQNPVINKLRVLSPFLLFMMCLMTENQIPDESDHEFYVKVITKIIEEITTLIPQLNIDDMSKEDIKFIENDFTRAYRGIIYSLSVMSEQLLVFYLDYDRMLDTFRKSFDLLYLALTKWADICSVYKSARTHSPNLFSRKNLLVVFLFGIHNDETYQKFAKDEKILDLLITYCGKYFYLIAELYALQAYEPEKIITIKLKSLAYLDKTGSRIFQNYSIKTLEKYWQEELKATWNEKFSVQKQTDKENKHSNKIVTPKETIDMKGKVNLPIEGNTVSVSTLTFLIEGIDVNAKNIMQAILRNIVVNTQDQISEIIKSPAVKQDANILRMALHSQIGCLAVLLKNYPELSAIVASYKTESKVDVANVEYTDFLPQQKDNESFLGFYVRNVCYFYHFTVSYLLEAMVEQNETAIFIQCEGEPILLSVFNELVIFEEIFKTLEDTFKEPEKFLKTLYTSATWTSLSQISINLLKLRSEIKQKDYRLEIIQRLYSLCLEALKVYRNANKKQEIHLMEESKVINVFMVDLVDLETSIRAKAQLIKNPKPVDQSVYTKGKLKWVCSLLKEHSYLEPSSQIDQNTIQPLPVNLRAHLEEESKLIEKYSPGSERIHANVILGLFNEAKALFYKGHPNLPEINLFNFSSDQTKELELTLKRFGPQSNYAHHLKGDYQKQIADKVYHYLQDYSDNLSQAYLNRFGLEGSCLVTKAKLFVPPLDVDRIHRIQPQPTFRVLVKKSVGWHYEKKEENIVIEAAAQLIEDKKEENFGALIKKMGLDKLKDLIRKNKRRIKLMIQQQHEKYLMAKLESMLKREVNITEMMSLDVDVDNQAFFNEKNDLDKKLIMLLANKDFLDSLTKEIQDQSKSLKKAFIDEDKKNGGDEDNSEDDEGSDDDDDDDDGNNNRRINRRRREELRRQANSEDENDDDDEDDDSDLSEDDGDDDKDSEEHKEDKEKANVVNKDKIEAVDNKDTENKEQVEVENGISVPEEKKEEKPEQKDIAIPEVIPSSQPEEINNKKEDKKEEEKRDESKGEENVVYYATGSESNFEGDSDYYEDDENSLGSSGEKGEVWEEQKGEPEIVRSQRSINQETKPEEKKEIDTNKDANDGLLEDDISSNCHTQEVSEVFYEPESVDENENDDYYSEGEEEEHDEGSVNYDYLHEVNDENDDISELTEFKGFMVQTKKAEKTLIEAKFLPRPAELFLMNPGTEASLQDLPEQILFLFSFNKKLDVLDSTGQLSKMDSYSLFYKFLITVLLDPYKEATILPLLALYLLGYNLKASKNIPSKSMVKDKIINFLHQYAIRSPSIFFKSFNISSFDAYLEHSEIEGEPLKDFTLLDLLFKFYFISCSTKTKKTDTTGIYILLQRLLHLLLQIRFLCKDEELPAYLKELRSKGQPPLKEDIMEEVFKVSEKFSKVPNSIDITQFCKWLEYLARLPQYRKGILIACDRMLSSQISEEKALLENFIKEAKQSLNSSNEPTSADKYIYNNFSSKLNPQTPLILNIFSYILNEAEIDSEIKSFVQEAETFKFALKDIALLYMEVLELISKLKDKNYIEFRTGLKHKLKKMIEVPVQYHLYLSKLKDAGLGSPSKSGGLDLTTPPSLVKISSDTDSLVPPGLERSYSSARNESVNFQEILTQWMKKHRNFINTTFKVSSVGKENLDLWIVKKFPWVLDFNVKEKILRDAFAERNKGEDEMDDDDEITLFIRRKHILHDTLQEFERHSQETTIYNFKIEFVNEPGVDQGGLKKEWLNLLSKEIFDPMAGLFKLSANLRSIHPNPISRIQPGVSTYFKLAGILVGLAIKEKIPIDVNFSKSFLKILLDTQPNLNDLEDLDPDFMQSLTWMLQNDVSVLEQPFIYELEIFGLKTVQELKENGSNIIVDESNKELYVSKILQSKTLKEVEPQIHSFKTGLFEIVPEDLARLFSSGEMEILISGKSQIDIKDLMQHVNYRELNKDSLLVKWFWEIVEFMDQNMLANLLFFITGSSKVPHGGFKDSPIVLARGPSDTSSLPIAHTCFSELEIPLYESKEQFSEKLFLAISEGKEGFYIA